MWVLFIHPHDSQTKQWEAKTFTTEEECEKYINSARLTREHYGSPVEELVDMLKKDFDNAYRHYNLNK